MSNKSTKSHHKQWRKQFREAVFRRDGNRCRICGQADNLDAHHITDRHLLPAGGYVTSNGITLCGGENQGSCHWMAEQYHITNGTAWKQGFHPDDLYRIIDSSFEQAKEDALKLEKQVPKD